MCGTSVASTCNAQASGCQRLPHPPQPPTSQRFVLCVCAQVLACRRACGVSRFRFQGLVYCCTVSSAWMWVSRLYAWVAMHMRRRPSWPGRPFLPGGAQPDPAPRCPASGQFLRLKQLIPVHFSVLAEEEEVRFLAPLACDGRSPPLSAAVRLAVSSASCYCSQVDETGAIKTAIAGSTSVAGNESPFFCACCTKTFQFQKVVLLKRCVDPSGVLPSFRLFCATSQPGVSVGLFCRRVLERCAGSGMNARVLPAWAASSPPFFVCPHPTSPPPPPAWIHVCRCGHVFCESCAKKFIVPCMKCFTCEAKCFPEKEMISLQQGGALWFLVHYPCAALSCVDDLCLLCGRAYA